jgi:hypothetical protein
VARNTARTPSFESLNELTWPPETSAPDKLIAVPPAIGVLQSSYGAVALGLARNTARAFAGFVGVLILVANAESVLGGESFRGAAASALLASSVERHSADNAASNVGEMGRVREFIRYMKGLQEDSMRTKVAISMKKRKIKS